MSKESNQSRVEQYGSVGTGGKNMKAVRAFPLGQLQGTAGSDPVQPNNRGNQAQK